MDERDQDNLILKLDRCWWWKTRPERATTTWIKPDAESGLYPPGPPPPWTPVGVCPGFGVNLRQARRDMIDRGILAYYDVYDYLARDGDAAALPAWTLPTKTGAGQPYRAALVAISPARDFVLFLGCVHQGVLPTGGPLVLLAEPSEGRKPWLVFAKPAASVLAAR